MSDPIVEELKRIIANELAVEWESPSIDPNAPLFEGGLGLDSMMLVDLIAAVEKCFDVELTDDDLRIETFESLSTLARFVRGRLEAGLPGSDVVP